MMPIRSDQSFTPGTDQVLGHYKSPLAEASKIPH